MRRIRLELILHGPKSENGLPAAYRLALENAIELYIVSAYLTEWDPPATLNANCARFRIIIGKDFGITRKAACSAVLSWLPPQKRSMFLVADLVGGFHPKAAFWKDNADKCYAIVGSSNLTKAAFNGNFEVNVSTEISAAEFEYASNWISEIEPLCVPVSEDWLAQYVESSQTGRKAGRAAQLEKMGKSVSQPVVSLKIPRPAGMVQELKNRRVVLENFKKKRTDLKKLLMKCADGGVTSSEFYEALRTYWGYDPGTRIQYSGWERKGKASNFSELSKSLLRVLSASKQLRDDFVQQEIDRLADLRVPTRKALFSELLCLHFPKSYPLLNSPVEWYLEQNKFRAPRGSTEGGHYIDLSRKLRAALKQNPNHPAKTLAELDAVIFLEKKRHDARKSA